jgi:hypothetical protein
LQVVHSPDALKWQVYAAPEPREVIWSNLAKPVSQRALRKAIVYVVVFLIILFFMIPILFISALTTLNNLETLVPFIKAILKIKPLTAVIQVSFYSCCVMWFKSLQLPTYRKVHRDSAERQKFLYAILVWKTFILGSLIDLL